MELTDLKSKILSYFSGTKQELDVILLEMNMEEEIYPFNGYEYLVFKMFERGDLSIQTYKELRNDYKSKNLNLNLFTITSPRGFGETFCQNYLKSLCGKLKDAPNTSYDLLLDDIKIEVKASRAVDRDEKVPLYMKALSRNTDKKYLMNFQQLKPQYCDVFVWVAIFRDETVLWVLNSKEVSSNPGYVNSQHRGNEGNEGQLGVKSENIDLFANYEIKECDLEMAIRDAYGRLTCVND